MLGRNLGGHGFAATLPSQWLLQWSRFASPYRKREVVMSGVFAMARPTNHGGLEGIGVGIHDQLTIVGAALCLSVALQSDDSDPARAPVEPPGTNYWE